MYYILYNIYYRLYIIYYILYIIELFYIFCISGDTDNFSALSYAQQHCRGYLLTLRTGKF